uniref:Afadin n=1 Tax=Strongyloides stercoralis TaxID=6248 RepID=A0AAF5CY40_STRER
MYVYFLMYGSIDSKSPIESSFLEENFEAKRKYLIELIENWNENRLELFAISMPEGDSLEIYGAMRFYFRDTGEKVFSKCIRVSSTATTESVIEALVEKFRPDMKMLTTPEYSLWEAHENGNERKLGRDEKPLLVQLNWHKDDKDGRFILKNDNEPEKINRNTGRFSKRLKNELKKRSKSIDNVGATNAKAFEEPKTVTEEVFSDASSNPFNRTISNPEVVMKKRREQKLENKLKEIMGSNGGSLKIYGHNINPFKNYVSILVSIYDRASKILIEALQKYGIENEDPNNFVLTQKIMPHNSINRMSKSISDLREEATEDVVIFNERVLDGDECPLLNLLNHKEKKNDNRTSNEEIIFTLKRCTVSPKMPPQTVMATQQITPSPIYQHLNKNSMINLTTSQYQQSLGVSPTNSVTSSSSPMYGGGGGGGIQKSISKRPAIVPINHLTGKENHDSVILIQPNVTIIGSNPDLAQPQNQAILLTGQNVIPRHCLISFSDGSVSITPLDGRGIVEVNERKIISTTLLKDGFTIKIGNVNGFRFYSNYNQNKYIFNNNLLGSHQLLSTSPSINDPTMPITTHFDANPYAAPVYPRKGSVSSIYSSQSPYNLTSNNYFGTQQSISVYPPQNLPALIEVIDQFGNDDLFLSLLITNSTIQLINFRPSPAFILYMSLRHRSSTLYKPSITMDIRNGLTQQYFDMICKKITHVIYSNPSNVDSLAFWLTVSSELLFIIQSDVHLNSILLQLRDNLYNLVEKCFSLLNDACHVQLSYTMYTFLNGTIDDGVGSNETISIFENIMSQLRRNRTNAALQIQIFSQLFHYVNMYIFNWLVGTEEGASHLTLSWAIHLKERLYHIYKWAENHGLELAVECHMDRIQQAVNLLTTPKTVDQVAVLGATCYKLNSRQVEYLLRRYISDVSETPVSESIINDCIKLSQSQADESAKEEGLPVELLEERRLNVPFMFPQEGYVIQLQKGIPSYLMELIDYLEQQGVCRFIPLPNINGSWTVHMKNYIHNSETLSQASTEFASSRQHINNMSHIQTPPTAIVNQNTIKPQVVSISFAKINNGIGLSIVAAQSTENKNVGIYVKKVFEGGAAYKDGRIETGDQLLTLNGHSLIGISQEAAAEIMAKCGPQLNFEVAKNAAYCNGLSSWFSKANENNEREIKYQQRVSNNQTPIYNGNNNYSSTVNGNNYSIYRPRTTSESSMQSNFNNNLSKQTHHLPSHYRTSTRPPIIQPGRPSSYNTSSNNISSSSLGCPPQHNDYSSMNQMVNKNMLPSTVRVRSSSVIPFGQENTTTTTTTTILPPRIPMNNIVSSQGGNNLIIKKDYLNNGRRSAPLFGEELTPKELREKLNDELDVLEGKGDRMTEYDRIRYRELVQQLGNISTSPQKSYNNNIMNGGGGVVVPRHRHPHQQPPPFLSEMTSKFEQKRQSQSSSISGSSSSHNQHRNGVESLIDNVVADVKKINLVVEENQSKEGTFNNRLNLDNNNIKLSNTLNITKICNNQQVEQLSPNSQEENKNPLQNNIIEKSKDEPRVRNEDEVDEPRVQIIGSNEIYNDPRVRRLNEIQSRSNRTNVDGSNLDFKDKMKMFAASLGEETPKAKICTSSAQREIEHSLEK